MLQLYISSDFFSSPVTALCLCSGSGWGTQTLGYTEENIRTTLWLEMSQCLLQKLQLCWHKHGWRRPNLLTAGRSAAPLKHYSSVRLTDRDADSNCGCPFGSLAVCNSTSAPPPPVTQVIIQPAWAWWWWAAAGKLTGEWSPGSLTALRNHSVLSINIL